MYSRPRLLQLDGGASALQLGLGLLGLVPGDALQEPYLVYAGHDQSVLIGGGQGTASFDLSLSGLGNARYLKIVDEAIARAGR